MTVGRRKVLGAGLTGLTGAAALLVVGMLAVILVDVVRGGAGRLSWEFLTAAPDQGMMAGGIFPAIYGTAVMTLLMTVAVMPVFPQFGSNEIVGLDDLGRCQVMTGYSGKWYPNPILSDGYWLAGWCSTTSTRASTGRRSTPAA